MSVEFCDTNIVIYAYDVTAADKHLAAKELLSRLWRKGNGAVSVQVLQELFVTLTRKLPLPLPWEKARGIVADLASWHTVAPDGPSVLAAIDLAAQHHLSFWDAMIVTAAQKAGADVLWTEDLNAGQNFGGVAVSNPF
ncbi:MAG: PIN domain-containing protein [Thermaerobacter sp.]|jgi:predicted nucleic acid-binding protein|nr:PIN domain-containing protein [Thermaerobacter sp.]